VLPTSTVSDDWLPLNETNSSRSNHRSQTIDSPSQCRHSTSAYYSAWPSLRSIQFAADCRSSQSTGIVCSGLVLLSSCDEPKNILSLVVSRPPIAIPHRASRWRPPDVVVREYDALNLSPFAKPFANWFVGRFVESFVNGCMGEVRFLSNLVWHFQGCLRSASRLSREYLTRTIPISRNVSSRATAPACKSKAFQTDGA
jgi:hypothetical protein